MSVRFSVTRIAAIAFFFLAAGAARPAFLLAESFLPKAEQEILCSQDFGDGEEQEDTSDSSETDAEDDVFKIMADGMTLAFARAITEQAFTAYSLVFPEHHPEIITPPPKA